MEDLSELKKQKVVSSFIICQLAGAGTDFPKTMSSYRCNFARLVDKSINEYASSRDYVLAEVNEHHRSAEDMMKNGQYIYAHFISNELENCFSTVRRLFNYFEKIKSDKTQFNIDRTFRKKIVKFEDGIKTIRDLIHHIEKDISEGKIKKGEVIAPMINDDATEVKIGNTTLKITDLSKVLRYFHQFGLDFMQYKFVPNKGYEKIK